MNRELLKYCMARAGITATEMANRLGITRQAFYRKLAGQCAFRYSDICIIIKACHLTLVEVGDIFFANVVNTDSTGVKNVRA